jgi:hypothetical protein
VSHLPREHGDPWFPRDLLDEIDVELVVARRRMAWDDARVHALEELLETARRVARQLGRSPTLVDLVATAPSATERERLSRLMQALRSAAEG